MNASTDVALWLYTLMLRLYPTRFRAEFADEMRAVFEQTIAETNDSFSLLGVMGAELRDLPFSVIREHLRERNRKARWWSQECITMRWRYFSPRLFRLCVITLFSLFALYICSASLAYIVFDLAHNDLSKAWEWWHDVGDQPGNIGKIFPFTLVGIFLWVISPALIVLAGGFLFFMLWRQWYRLSRRLRGLAIAALLLGSAMFATMGSPIGYMAALWFYD